MLQPYANQTDIPEALREHYSKREDNQWHADIPDTHPAVKHNAKLLSEKNTAEGKVTQLTSDLESARAGNLGRGQVAVAKSDVALLDEYKALGTPAEIKPKLEEHGTLKEKDQTRAREDSLRKVAEALQFNEKAFVLLPKLPDFIAKPGKDGKDEWFAQIKDDKGVITEKPAKEFIESSQDIAPFMASLKVANQQSNVQLPGSSMSVNTSNGRDPDAWAKAFADDYSKSSAPAGNLYDAFYGVSKPAA